MMLGGYTETREERDMREQMEERSYRLREQMEQWQWKNCRNVGFKLNFWPLNWRTFLTHTWSDQYAWTWEIQIGPLGFEVLCNVGN